MTIIKQGGTKGSNSEAAWRLFEGTGRALETPSKASKGAGRASEGDGSL